MILKWLRKSLFSLKPGVKILPWRAEVFSSFLQLYPRGPPWQLEERSSPWQRPHRTPSPRLWPASSCSSSSRLFSCRTLQSQRPRPRYCLTRWPNKSAQRRNIQKCPSKVRHHLLPLVLHNYLIMLHHIYMGTRQPLARTMQGINSVKSVFSVWK